MRIDVHNIQRQSLIEIEVDPKRPPVVVKVPQSVGMREAAPGPEIDLRWEQALDDRGYLRRCPVCECRELFVRRDFPQAVGMILVAVAIIASLVLFGLGYVRASWVVLGLMVAVDAGILHLLTGHCLVCYRCRSEFRDLPISEDQHGWDLATGESIAPSMISPRTIHPMGREKTNDDHASQAIETGQALDLWRRRPWFGGGGSSHGRGMDGCGGAG